ncbi:UNVERIFIED_CONTAM: hypothetical protein GTU68_052773 [Idotea baltica]|nr:hypothetical protein [Idotea baltica]
MTNPLDKVEDVDIEIGKFKYILIKVNYSPPNSPEVYKFIVRGYISAGFHADIYERVAPSIEKTGILDCECVGGGRIIHDIEKRRIDVFGYSQGYGKAKHSITCELLKKNTQIMK